MRRYTSRALPERWSSTSGPSVSGFRLVVSTLWSEDPSAGPPATRRRSHRLAEREGQESQRYSVTVLLSPAARSTDWVPGSLTGPLSGVVALPAPQFRAVTVIQPTKSVAVGCGSLPATPTARAVTRS